MATKVKEYVLTCSGDFEEAKGLKFINLDGDKLSIFLLSSSKGEARIYVKTTGVQTVRSVRSVAGLLEQDLKNNKEIKC